MEGLEQQRGSELQGMYGVEAATLPMHSMAGTGDLASSSLRAFVLKIEIIA